MHERQNVCTQRRQMGDSGQKKKKKRGENSDLLMLNQNGEYQHTHTTHTDSFFFFLNPNQTKAKKTTKKTHLTCLNCKCNNLLKMNKKQRSPRLVLPGKQTCHQKHVPHKYN